MGHVFGRDKRGVGSGAVLPSTCAYVSAEACGSVEYTDDVDSESGRGVDGHFDRDEVSRRGFCVSKCPKLIHRVALLG